MSGRDFSLFSPQFSCIHWLGSLTIPSSQVCLLSFQLYSTYGTESWEIDFLYLITANARSGGCSTSPPPAVGAVAGGQSQLDSKKASCFPLDSQLWWLWRQVGVGLFRNECVASGGYIYWPHWITEQSGSGYGQNMLTEWCRQPISSQCFKSVMLLGLTA